MSCSSVISFLALLWLATFLLSSAATPLAMATEVPSELKGVGITEHLGESVSIKELAFRDESGKPVHLSDYFRNGKPVLLALVYYECPNLCNFLLNGLNDGLKKLDWTPGQQFEIVTVSINPNETPELASKKKASYLQAYGRPEAASGWHFLTTQSADKDSGESHVRKLASQVGFGYRYDQIERQYAHSAALFVLTPEGRISRYLYGIEFRKQDLRLALLEASSGKIGTVIDRFLLFCYRYNPTTRKYSVVLTKLMQAGAAGTVLILGSYVAVFWIRQSRRNSLGLKLQISKNSN